MNKFITFTSQILADFKDAYEFAVDSNQDTFIFRDDVFVTSYAKYLIQYLESQGL